MYFKYPTISVTIGAQFNNTKNSAPGQNLGNTFIIINW